MEWFKTLFGFREKGLAYDEVQAKFEIVNETQLCSLTNGKTYDIGTFECLSLATLRDHAMCVGRLGHVRLTHAASKDVFLLHCDPRNRHATFQAASQFNCLEFAHPRARPEDGVTIYAHDMTQGPACAIAAGPGTVFRNYFASPDADQQGQRAASQINNLEDVEDMLDNERHQYFRVVNGYTDATNASLQRLNDVLETANTDDLENALKVGVHWNVEVPFQARYRPSSPSSDKQLVTQVYCSAISCGYSYASATAWAPFASLVLRASYEATLWAAIINASITGSTQVFLTVLGGGVFGNKTAWILDAIAVAVAKCHAFDLDVVIVHYMKVDKALVTALDKLLPIPGGIS
ncbi:hypothetical protein SPRG_03058 [Saprolegnia parasitica CBS 223.65]|uniref:Macro domain-containing protein n=1 Tax=Saprolegnia parasitica (strain CBS 223.65) TaxID=695850 RepID=A0A067CPF5_SAPPC|nr:hypothetical protein SPRG_03058 [Saprolegnia parasitica CBS 223.65]KDO32584.1 hypothetical protein SPRG_03058 [Saprolegnia parasitica CBS 223.65]|eukprot:XP_012197029.1 hypothetical protein SPRG_03058 [Saprolegnia parasitica CBS 223.65]